MFKVRVPMAIVVSSGSLLLLAIGSLLLISSAAHTSDIRTIDQEAKIDQNDANTTTTNSVPLEAVHVPRPEDSISRRRGARLYSQDESAYGSQRRQSQESQQQQQRSLSMESYAAALAAANSADQPNSNSDLVQSTIQSTDAGNYASFGEQPPSQAHAGSTGSTARQFEASEYGPVHATGSSYYGNHMSPSMSSSATNYLPNSSGHSSGAYHQPAHTHSQHHQSTPYSHHHYAASKKAPMSMPLGYPSYDYSSSHYLDRSSAYPATPYWAGSPHTSSSGFGSSLMSSASSALSHWTGGFGIAEIICGIIALSIGAVILGAPFFLIYLALMGNFSGSSTLSMTNPTQGSTTPGQGGSSTTVNGRRKRLAIYEPTLADLDLPQVQFSALADSVIGQLSPFVDIQQVSTTFKRLVDSIEKYSKMNHAKEAKKPASSRN